MRRFLSFLLAIGLVCGASQVYAGDQESIASIDVLGNISVSSEVVISQLQSKEGAPFLKEVVNDDLRRLYSLGYFSDVSVEVDNDEAGVALTFVVEEKFAIGSLDVIGQHSIRKSLILKELGLSEGHVYNKKTLKESIDRVIDLYSKKGYHKVSIDPQVSSDNLTRRVDILLVIDEEQKISVKDIRFVGNKELAAGLLKKKMKTKQKWLFGGGVFKSEQLEEDVERLAAVYKSKGYMKVDIGEPQLVYEDEGRSLVITIPITEGLLYRVGIVEISGNELFPREDIEDVLTMKDGAIFSQFSLLKDQRAISEYYSDRGYIFSRINPSTHINDDAGVVDVSYRITENELAYVERVIIQGNIVTKDKVIRRQLKIHPLDPFDGQKIKRSREKLYNLNYFEDVTFETAPGSEANLRDLVVNVKEKKTGEFSFGGGYSSLDKLVGFIEVAQNNFDLFNFPSFVGGGQRMHVRAELGGVRKNYSLGFTEPWLFDYPLLFGFDLYSREWKRSGYSESRKGASVRLGHPLGADNYILGSLKHEQVDIGIDDASRVPSEIIGEKGEKTINALMLKLSRDTRDSHQLTTSGGLHSFSIEPMGGILGGDVDVVRYTASTAWYHEVWKDKWILETRARVGSMDRYDDTLSIPFYERFYAGGSSTIRGYEDRSVGPLQGLEPIGGSSMLILNAEYSFPLIETMRGALFIDAGNVWAGGDDWELDDLKKGVGFGVRIKTPLGPVKLDYGFALNENDHEDDSRLHFSMGGFF